MQLLFVMLSMSLSGILAGAMILLLKPISKRYFSGKWQYYIWIIVMIRLMLPIQLPINFVGTLFLQSVEKEQKPEVISPDVDNTRQQDIVDLKQWKEKEIQDDNNILGQDEKEKSFAERSFFQKETILHSLPAIWLFGVFFLFLLKLIDNRNFIAYLKSGNHKIEDEQKLAVIDDVMLELEIKKDITIYENSLIISPMLVQITNPFIVLPQIEFDLQGYRYILMHELIHYKRKDLCYKWVFQLIWCIHWFNPFLLIMNREMNQGCELSCDEEVIKQLSKEEKKKYGEVLLDMADIELKFRNKVLSSSLIEKKINLKERIVNIMKEKKTNSINVIGSFLCIGVISLFSAVAGAKPVLKTKPIESADMVQNIGLSTSVLDSVNHTNTYSWKDGFNNFSESSVKKNGEAYKAYEDDSKIAGDDVCDIYFYNFYSKKENGSYNKEKICLNGTNTEIVWYVSKDTTIKVSYYAKVKEGNCKLVQITSDHKVITLVEGAKNSAMNFDQTISLKKGRNALKLVGKAAALQTASLELSNIDSSAISKYYKSEKEEKAGIILNQIKNGNYGFDALTKKQLREVFIYGNKGEINELLKEGKSSLSKQQLQEILPYLGKDNITTYIKQALQKGGSFTDSELKSLFIYGEGNELLEVLDKYNYELTKQKVREILPYLGKEGITNYTKQVLQRGESFTDSELKSLFIYGEGNELLEVLDKYNYELTKQELKELMPYLGKEGITNYTKQVLQKGGSFTDSELKSLFIYGEGNKLLEVLDKYNYELTKQELKELMPYLGKEGITNYTKQVLQKGGSFTDSELKSLFIYGEGNELLEVLDKYNYELTKQKVREILPYLGKEGITDYTKQVLQKGGSFTDSELKSLFIYGEGNELLEVLEKYGHELTKGEFKEILPYLGKEGITNYTKQVLQKGGSFTDSELKSLFIYGEGNELLEVLDKYNYELTKQKAREILPYLGKDGITSYVEQVLKKGGSFSNLELKDFFIYGDEEELFEIITKN